MRIHRLHLQHVAGVDDRELRFDDGVTVVVGPNEAGKSTLATALQLLLEQKDRWDNAEIRAVRPVHVDADPTIELECTTGPYHLTYRKVFGRTASRRETSLVVHAPSPASLTGDAAHDRMTAILDETVDGDLWAALRVQQRHDLDQAALAEAGALMAALDAAGDGTGPDDGSLLARVEEEAARFWTSTGRPRRPLVEADEAVDAAEEALAEARTQLDEVAAATAQHDRLVDRVAQCTRELPDLERRAKRTAEALDELVALRDRVADADRDVTRARDRHDAARAALEARRTLEARIARGHELVRDQEEGVPGVVDPFEQGHDPAAGRRVDVPGGLVRQDERGLGRERPGDGHPLALAAGQLRRGVVEAVAEADRLEPRPRPVAALRAAGAPEQEGERDVLEGGEPGHEVERLEDEPDLLPADGGPLRAGQPGDLAAADPDRARRRRVETADEVEDGALPGAARAHDGRERPPRERERDVPERVDPAAAVVGPPDAGKLDRGNLAAGPLPTRSCHVAEGGARAFEGVSSVGAAPGTSIVG